MRRPSPPAAGDPTLEASGGGARKGAPKEETLRFCNNPACDRCDLLLRPHEALRKGGDLVCPKCLEPLMVRRLRARPATLPFRPGSGPSPSGPAGKSQANSPARNKV